MPKITKTYQLRIGIDTAKTWTKEAVEQRPAHAMTVIKALSASLGMACDLADDIAERNKKLRRTVLWSWISFALFVALLVFAN